MKLALVFPGQGSQTVGMMQGFADTKVVRDTFAEASAALGQDLWQLAAEGPAEELNATVNTQPVMLTAAYAMYRAWQDAGGPAPAMVAGHSLGEYTALVVAGVLDFADAVPLVRFRAQAMQEAVPRGTGAMAAILGLDDDAVRSACAESAQGEVVEPVNFNAPSQVVIAGHKAAVERGAAAAKARGAKRAVMLPVSAPFHSSLLKPAAERLKARMQDIVFRAPRVAVVNNVDVATVNDPEQIKEALARQACNPVRWVETVQAFSVQGVTHVVECGPGKVLAGLTKRIVDGMQGYAVTDPASLQQTLEALR
ncbi:MAG: ACP S-malonyltransferase [Betaproteobacteria bacterium]|jgi:[acyl-carrier-protein] S-malonyltransferase|nr:ACP S-malonyltransferase [Betaproteobacteria bacterium]MDH4292977.1 ACP S-malonyltransferase [Betaproteobacteria bacterium]MDH5342261.1 ACP S-malonyltransferase [Betaproteobacteria bacterium]